MERQADGRTRRQTHNRIIKNYKKYAFIVYTTKIFMFKDV